MTLSLITLYHFFFCNKILIKNDDEVERKKERDIIWILPVEFTCFLLLKNRWQIRTFYNYKKKREWRNNRYHRNEKKTITIDWIISIVQFLFVVTYFFLVEFFFFFLTEYLCVCLEKVFIFKNFREKKRNKIQIKHEETTEKKTFREKIIVIVTRKFSFSF